ncbi:hypothetical protein ACJX0J_020266, partial [Zea mays]
DYLQPSLFGMDLWCHGVYVHGHKLAIKDDDIDAILPFPRSYLMPPHALFLVEEALYILLKHIQIGFFSYASVLDIIAYSVIKLDDTRVERDEAIVNYFGFLDED